VDALITDFRATGGNAAEVRAQMEQKLASQADLDAFRGQKRAGFESFMADLAQELKKHVGVDDLIRKTNTAMVRPRQRVQRVDDIKPMPQGAPSPAFAGYAGTGDILMFAMLWSVFCHDQNFHISDTALVDESGGLLATVGETGFDAGANDMLNPDTTFEPVPDADLTAPSSEHFAGDVSADSGSWFDGGGFDGGDFGGGDASCGASCGGCGGCA
jgi:hypothetical protein